MNTSAPAVFDKHILSNQKILFPHLPVRLHKKIGRILRILLVYLLTLWLENGKVNKNAMMKTSKRTCPSFRELPFGARQQKERAEFLSERLC